MGASSDAGLARLNALPADAARAALRRCCGSARWADAMAAGRPYSDAPALFSAAERTWSALAREDWLEAFAHHPRIGDRGALQVRFPGTRAWSASEQDGVATATADVLDALAEGNRAYEDRFGHAFLVCATGKSADEMLALLRERLPNALDVELGVAAAEQAKITRLRLARLLEEVSG